MAHTNPTLRFLQMLGQHPITAPLPQDVEGCVSAINWRDFLGVAAQHRIVPMVTHRLHQHDLHTKVPRYIYKAMADLTNTCHFKAEQIQQEVRRIALALQQANLPHAFVKGVVLDQLVYAGHGLKSVNDIDVLCLPDHQDHMLEVLGQLGYTPGIYQRKTRSITMPDRRTQLLYRLNPDHLPKLIRLVDHPIVERFVVDVSLSATWHSSDQQVPLADLLATARGLPAGELARVAVLSPEIHFVYLLLHFFREAWLENNLKNDDKSLNFIKCYDITHLWMKHTTPEWNRAVSSLLGQYSLEACAAWVTGNLDEVFGLNLTQQLELTPWATPLWLRSTSGTAQTGQVFAAPFTHRLLHPGEILLEPSTGSPVTGGR